MARFRAYILLLLVGSCGVAGVRLGYAQVDTKVGGLVLADNGRSAYRIVLAEDASLSTKHGAEELQMFLEQISGAKLAIVSDQQPPGPNEILLGDNAHLRSLGVAIDFAALGKEGYVIRTVGDHLVIAGGQMRGNMYGVYGFLEDHLGCRWFAPGVSRIPKSTRLAIGPIDDRQMPVLEYRDLGLSECLEDGDWCARNRMNSSFARLEPKHGGRVMFGGGYFVHTFERLVPPEKYFGEHPEYFSLVKGNRQKKESQLCCTNPDVIRICTEVVREAMRTQPHATVFSVSQNDWGNHCECPNCQEVAKQEDSQIGPVLQLVNRVAESVENDFPDNIVETLAYQWTRHPPKHMRPRPNVVVRLCTFECCFSHPLATCDSKYNKAFREDIDAWAKVANRLWVWDYTTCFTKYLRPFPNQRARAANIRFFVAHNVTGIYEEDATETADSELWALGGYMTAKLLWNPNYDANKAMNEFLEGYYGKAATPIRTYLDMLNDRVERENIHVNIWGFDAYPDDGGTDSLDLTDDLLTNANELWQQAEDLVTSEPEVIQRVRRSRMSVDYAILERARLQAKKNLPESKQFLSLAAVRFRPFFDVLQSSNLTALQIRLMVNTPFDKEVYRHDLAKELGMETDK